MTDLLRLLPVLSLIACFPTKADDDDDGDGEPEGGWDLGTDSGTADGGGGDGGTSATSDGGGGDGGSGDGGSGDGGSGDGGSGDGGSGDGGSGDGGVEYPLEADIEGWAYVLDLDGATFVDPAGIGDLLIGELDQQILVGVVEAGTHLTLRVGASDGGASSAQDMCVATYELPRTSFADAPAWEVGPTELTTILDGYELIMSEATISGVFAADGRSYTDSILDAYVDARKLGDLLEDTLGTTDPSELCDLVIGFGVSCVPCPSDGVELCLHTRIEDVTGSKIPGSLTKITDADIAGNPDCD